METYQVVIIGAGPVGGRMATELALRGLRVLMIEEHAEIGRPFQCAGLVNPPSMKAVGLEETILQNIDGAKIHSPSGIMVPVGTEGLIRTHVVCRKKFDQGVVAQAQRAGAHLWLLSKPTSVNMQPNKCILTVEKNGRERTISCKLLIGADGAHSWTRRYFKMGRPKEMMLGFQVEVCGLKGGKNWLEMYSGEDVAPGLFAWVIPSGNGTHRIGTWTRNRDLEKQSVEQFYQKLITHPLWSTRFEGLREIGRYCGPVPCGIIKKPFSDRVILIGDAAGSAKPTTGGGIGPGFKQVELMADGIVNLVLNNRLKSSDLAKVCRPFKAMRKEQDRARALRDLIVSIPNDSELDDHFRMFNREKVLELINKEGDIEHPVRLGLSLVKSVPEFRKLAIKAGFKLIFS